MKPAEVSTPSDREVLVKRSFGAPVNLVWQAYTDPALMRRWLTGLPGWSMPVCAMPTHVGGKYRWRWRNDENGQEFGFTGEMLEVALYSKIVHTQIYDGNVVESMGSEPYIVRVTFNETNGITNVTTTIEDRTSHPFVATKRLWPLRKRQVRRNHQAGPFVTLAEEAE